MTREMILYERDLRCAMPGAYRLAYSLVTDEICLDGHTLEVYGAKIALYRGGAVVEEKTLRGLTPYGTRITAILGAMARGLVTPMGMADVVADLLASPGKPA